MIALGLGSNIDGSHSREENIAKAILLLNQHPLITVEKVSSLYETEPVGLKEQPSFLNAVMSVITSLSPLELLDVCLSIERQMGRVREVRWGPRNIDIDVLVYNDRIISDSVLELPHPRMQERKFVLIPLAEISGGFPVFHGKTAKDLLTVTTDDTDVKMIGTLKLPW